MVGEEALAKPVVAAEEVAVIAHETVGSECADKSYYEQKHSACPHDCGVGHSGVEEEAAGDERGAYEHDGDEGDGHLPFEVLEEEDAQNEKDSYDDVDDEEHGSLVDENGRYAFCGTTGGVGCGAEDDHEYRSNEQQKILPALNYHSIEFLCSEG